MKIARMRTTAFRLAPEMFGRVHAYRSGERFAAAWDQAQKARATASPGQRGSVRDLPYRSLAIALRLLTGDFVAMRRRAESAAYLFIARKLIDHHQLRRAFQAWEAGALGEDPGRFSGLVEDLELVSIDVASLVKRRQERCPVIEDGGNWIWDVAVWEVAHRMASRKLRTDGRDVSLHLDSDAALLTWSDLVQDETGRATAMHKITPKLITLPGVEDPIVSFQSGLVRLNSTWKYAKGAWALIRPDRPILRAAIRHSPTAEGTFATSWDDDAASVVERLSLDALAAIGEAPTVDGLVRAGYRYTPTSSRIGSGVGTMFHEIVAHHARAALGDGASPLEFVSSSEKWRTPSKATAPSLVFAGGDPSAKLRVLVVHTTSETRSRQRLGLKHLLAHERPDGDRGALARLSASLDAAVDGEVVREGELEIVFVNPPGSELLRRRVEVGECRSWVESWLSSVKTDVPTVALVETDAALKKGDNDSQDPKHLIRVALARAGVPSQFLSSTSIPTALATKRGAAQGKFVDHAAVAAASDVLRTGGFFLRPFPAEGMPAGSLHVGVFVTRATAKTTGKSRPVFFVNLVAAVAGERRALGWIPTRGWVPLHEATAWYLAEDHDADRDQGRRLVEDAVAQLHVAFDERAIVLYFDAIGCRSLWPSLADKSGGGVDGWMSSGGRTGIVRVRASGVEVPRVAGAGAWDSGLAPAGYTGFRVAEVACAEGSSPTFVLSGSAVMSRGREARKASRFTTSSRGMQENWHALSATELLVLHAGAFEESAVIRQAAMLCRASPTWEQTLRWPAPLHLARAVVRDHPRRQDDDGDETDGAADDGGIRMDVR